MNGYDLGNQSRDRVRPSRRWSTARFATGISEPSLFNTCCNVRLVATTNWLWIWLSALMRAVHCRSMRRWTFNGYMALIRSTSLTRLRLCNHLLNYLCTIPAFASLGGRCSSHASHGPRMDLTGQAKRVLRYHSTDKRWKKHQANPLRSV